MTVVEEQQELEVAATPTVSPRRRASAGQRSRRAVMARLRRLGVPASVVSGADMGQLRQLAADLDRFSAYGYDTATQRRFLREPHPGLRGDAPIDVMRQPEGIRLVREALRQTLRALAK